MRTGKILSPRKHATFSVTGGAEGCTARSTRQDGDEREHKWGSCVTGTEAWPSKVWARALLCNATSQGSSFVLPGFRTLPWSSGGFHDPLLWLALSHLWGPAVQDALLPALQLEVHQSMARRTLC